MSKTLYLIGGPMGVGKTTACRELSRMLPRSVFLDGDWCWQADPFQVTEETRAMVLDNIRHLLGNFLRCSAYEHVVFCWVMHEQAIVDAVLDGLPLATCEAQVRHVSLVASEDVLRERVERDIEEGRRDADAAARSLAYLSRYRSLDAPVVDTTGLSPHEVARCIAFGATSPDAPPAR